MTDFFYPAMFWGAVPMLISHLSHRDRLCLLLGGVFMALSLCLSIFPQYSLAQAGLQGLYFAVVALVPFLSRKALGRIRDGYSAQVETLRQSKEKAQQEFEALEEAQAVLSEQLGLLQNRFALVQVMATKLETGEILQTLGHTCKNIPGVRACLLLQRRPNGSWAVAHAGPEIKEPEAWVSLLEQHPALARSRRILRCNTADRHPVLAKIRHAVRPPFLLVPFFWDQEPLAFGYVEMDSPVPETSLEEIQVGRGLASLGLRRAALYSLMAERSRRDALTGVFLRRVLLERLQEAVQKARRYKTPLFFVLLDIDRFKAINDQRGHLLGDKVLAHLAKTLQRLATPGVFVARYGGDEFALILEVNSRQEALEWLENLRQTVSKAPLESEGGRLVYTLSVGMSEFAPHKISAEELIQRADQALYRAKEGGRDRTAVWSEGT